MGQESSKTATVTHRSRLAALAVLVVGALVAPGSVIPVAASERASSPHGASSSALATLDVESPTVQVKPAGKSAFVDAKDGRALKAGDTVKTSSTGRAEISYSDGSLTRLDVDTEYKLVKLSANKGDRRTKGLQTAGQTWHRVEALTENESYKVQGANATAAVLGTAFRVVCTAPNVVPKKCTYTAVIDPIVLTDSDPKGGTKTVTLTPGDQVEVTNNAIGTVTELTQEELLAIQWIVENLLEDKNDGKSTGTDEVSTQADPPRTRPPSSPVVTPPPLPPTTGTGTGTGAGTGTGTAGTGGDGGTDVPAPNQGPTANNDAYSMPEDTLLAIAAPGVLGNDSDPEGTPLQAFLTGLPTHGALTFQSTGAFVYFPDANFHGTDTFTYVAGDGEFGSLPATVTITVGATNDAPIALGDGYATNEDTPLVISAPGVLANDSDPDADALAAVVETGPSHGALALNGNGSFTYSPFADFNGTDAFTYRASDGMTQSEPATVTISVGAANDAPVASADSYTVDEGQTLTVPAPGILANDIDFDGDGLTAILEGGGEETATFQILSDVSDGQLTLNPDGSFTYTPDENFNGTDSFTYRASDGTAVSNEATVTITVTPVNDAPVATADDYEVTSNQALTAPSEGVAGVLANDSDPDGDALTFVFEDSDIGEGQGDLQFAEDGNGAFTYTPNGFVGTVHFSYHVTDGSLDSESVTVTITVTAPEQCTQAPEAVTSLDPSEPGQGDTVQVTITATDPCGGTPSLAVVVDEGELSLGDGIYDSESGTYSWVHNVTRSNCGVSELQVEFKLTNAYTTVSVPVTVTWLPGGGCDEA